MKIPLPKASIFSGVILASVVALVCFPLYIIFYLDPAVVALVTSTSEQEAIKVANFMAMELFPEAADFHASPLPDAREYRLLELQRQFRILKVKVFQPDGKIIFSNDPPEIGTINTHPYFRDTVAQGRPYSKVVHKDSASLEGQLMPIDVVETYVPIMHGSVFAGAFEIYYNNTQARNELRDLLSRVITFVGVMALGLLLTILVTFLAAARNLREKNEAVLALSKAHDELEERVTARTQELTQANQALYQEIAIRQAAEQEKERLIEELTEALAKVKTLSGLLPICANCQQIRDGEGKWSRVEDYIRTRTNAEFTHGICPKCAKQLYPDLYSQIEERLEADRQDR